MSLSRTGPKIHMKRLYIYIYIHIYIYLCNTYIVSTYNLPSFPFRRDDWWHLFPKKIPPQRHSQRPPLPKLRWRGLYILTWDSTYTYNAYIVSTHNLPHLPDEMTDGISFRQIVFRYRQIERINVCRLSAKWGKIQDTLLNLSIRWCSVMYQGFEGGFFSMEYTWLAERLQSLAVLFPDLQYRPHHKYIIYIYIICIYIYVS